MEKSFEGCLSLFALSRVFATFRCECSISRYAIHFNLRGKVRAIIRPWFRPRSLALLCSDVNIDYTREINRTNRTGQSWINRTDLYNKRQGEEKKRKRMSIAAGDIRADIRAGIRAFLERDRRKRLRERDRFVNISTFSLSRTIHWRHWRLLFELYRSPRGPVEMSRLLIMRGAVDDVDDTHHPFHLLIMQTYYRFLHANYFY